MTEQPSNGWEIEGVTTHPGVMLREDFLHPLQMSVDFLAERTGLDAHYLSDLLQARQELLPDAAMRLGRFFGTSAEFWLNLQTMHALSRARIESGSIVMQQVRPLHEAAA